jgi:hypothetical protein
LYLEIEPKNACRDTERRETERHSMDDMYGSREEHDEPIRYEIRLKGHLDARWAAWFADLSLIRSSDGVTLLAGPVADQAALHGLLRKVRDLGLPLISVTRVEPHQPDGSTIEPR